MHSVYGTVVVKKASSQIAKLPIYWSVLSFTQTYGQKHWVGLGLRVVTKLTRLQIQAAGMRFLPRMALSSLREREGHSLIPPHQKEPAEVALARVSDAP